jgi:hypothetical protein
MKWIFSIQQKNKAALVLFTVLVLVFTTNMAEQNNTRKINNALTSIYDDRLVVESYIFQYAELLRNMEDILASGSLESSDKKRMLAFPLLEIHDLNKAYKKTRLTKEEEIQFSDFEYMTERIFLSAAAARFDELASYIKYAGDMLPSLSAIQVSEAKNQLIHAEKIINNAQLFSQFEIAVLIVVALIIQALIYESKSLKFSVPTTKAELN